MRAIMVTFAILIGLATTQALAQAPSLSPATSLRIANEQLSRSDLTPRQKAQNLILRAGAYWQMNQLSEAFADLDRAEPLDAGMMPHARIQRALILSRSLGDLGKALAALETLPPAAQISAVALVRGEILMASQRNADAIPILEPIYKKGGDDAVRARRLLAQAYFNSSDFKKAVTLYDEMLPGAFERPDRQYPALWRFAAEKLMGLEAVTRLRNDTRPSDRLTWPGPIIKFALGDMSAAELKQAAQSDMLARSMGGACEAAFYIGIVEEKAERLDEARDHYRLARVLCHDGMFEKWGAHARLSKLR